MRFDKINGKENFGKCKTHNHKVKKNMMKKTYRMKKILYVLRIVQ